MTLTPGADLSSTLQLEISASRQFTAWLADQQLSLAFTTYRAGNLFFVGLKPDGSLSIFERTFERTMGLCVHGDSLWLSTPYQIWRFENSVLPGHIYLNYDAFYMPTMSYITGDLEAHDVAVSSHLAKPVFVNTLFSCLATVDETHSFVPIWQPPFISKLAAEDRCHLNGVALRDGQPRYVSAISQSDVADGWRDHRQDGGCVLDVESGEAITTQLSMPHSPRWYQGKLWLLNSGKGEFGYLDLATGDFVAVAFCPGYLRGLAFSGDFAIVGLSKPRQDKSFSGLPFDDIMQSKKVTPRCGLCVIDLRSGEVVHYLHIEQTQGLITELYDIATIPNVRRPMAIGLRSDEIRRVISVGSQ